MQSKRDGLIPIGEALADLPGPVQALIPSRPTQRHYTRFDQVNQLVGASEADPDLGFMARTMALCSLPRTNPGKIAWPDLNYTTAKGVLILSPSKPAIAPTTGPQRLVE